jgi:predicted flap endonuclease-1-like 5' DNA nuclease
MTIVAEAYLVALIAALLIGVVTAYWAFRRQASTTTPLEVTPPPPAVEAPRPEFHVPQPIEPHPAGSLDPLTPSLDTADYAAADVPLDEPGPADELQTLKGVGAKFAAKLQENGITRFDQLARLSDADIGLLDERMGVFKGRLSRDRVVEQATYLVRGDRAGFEAQFGKLGSGA